MGLFVTLLLLVPPGAVPAGRRENAIELASRDRGRRDAQLRGDMPLFGVYDCAVVAVNALGASPASGRACGEGFPYPPPFESCGSRSAAPATSYSRPSSVVLHTANAPRAPAARPR